MSDSPISTSRRRLLGGLSGALLAGTLAGCGGSDGASETTTGTRTEAAGNEEGTESTDAGEGTESTDAGEGTESTDAGEGEPSLDLREANVVDVAFERQNGAFAFDVTLHHDDDGEDGYANWWQVERLDGTRLGRRELLHAHSRQPFTRSDTVEIPEDVTCVAVRGHDQTHGYGGRLVLANLDSGATRPVDQGSERRAVGEIDCP
ncbi:hypothetical protein [Halobellus sp. GM3]|uniref:hypothetical protein n=1 Tax=Halobellus sp. GM3 TaxID=3458410 RepID=UPI00403DD52E